MAFYSYAELIQKTILRLRQVPGTGTQFYAEDMIGNLIVETYQYVRSLRYWDHLTKWQSARTLDGTTGKCTIGFSGARERFDDIEQVVIGSDSVPLPQLMNNINPYRLTGTHPRFIEPLHQDDDAMAEPYFLFRVWPLEATSSLVRVRLRTDPANLFTSPSVVVPFDDGVLVNGAAAKYSADDGTSSTAMLQKAYSDRLQQKLKDFDRAIIVKDDRLDSYHSSEWREVD